MHEWFLKNSFDAGVLPASAFVVSSCEPPLRLTNLPDQRDSSWLSHAQRPPHQRLRSSRYPVQVKFTPSARRSIYGFAVNRPLTRRLVNTARLIVTNNSG